MYLLSEPTAQNNVQRCWGTSKSLSALELVALKFLMRMFLPAGRQARKEASLDVIHPFFIVFSGMNGLASSALVLLVQAKNAQHS